MLEGKVPDGPYLGKPGKDVTLSGFKSVSLLAVVGGDEHIFEAHDRAVGRTLAWIERNAVETRMQHKRSGTMVRAGGPKMVAATFPHAHRKRAASDPGCSQRPSWWLTKGSLASTAQARDVLRIATAFRIRHVVLAGAAKQLDAVDADKPFAQLQAAGMKTRSCGRVTQRSRKWARSHRALEKLGSGVVEVKVDKTADVVAARWLVLSPEAHQNTGVMVPSLELGKAIDAYIRERLVREERIPSPPGDGFRAPRVKGHTNAEKGLAEDYAAGAVVAFRSRAYKRLGVEKGDERLS